MSTGTPRDSGSYRDYYAANGTYRGGPVYHDDFVNSGLVPTPARLMAAGALVLSWLVVWAYYQPLETTKADLQRLTLQQGSPPQPDTYLVAHLAHGWWLSLSIAVVLLYGDKLWRMLRSG